MPSVIDSLVLELGLDPTKWTKGQKEAVENLKKTEAEAIKRAKGIEEAGKRAAEFFSQLRNQVIGLYAAFTAGRGIKEFVQDITHSDAQIGYLAKRLDMSVKDLATFGAAMKDLGGTAEDSSSTFQAWVNDFQQFSLTGNSQFIPYWRSLGIAIADSNGNMKSGVVLAKELNAAFSKLDPARAAALGQSMGITPKMMDLLLKAPDQYAKILSMEEKVGAATARAAAAAQAREVAWNHFINTAATLGENILTVLTPALQSVMDILQQIADWFAVHPAAAEAAFAGITVVAGLLTTALSVGLLKFALSPLITAFKVLRVAMFAAFTPVGGIVAGILVGLALLAAATYEIYEHWDDLKKIIESVGASLNTVVDKARSFFGLGGTAAKPTGAAKSTATPPAQSDIDTLTKLGWSREQAIGILANVQRESGGKTNAVGDKGSAYGLAQWHPDRQAAFAKWAGHDIRSSTREEQLGFINYELRQGGERSAGQRLASATSAQSAAQIVSRFYERPANADREAATRASIAAAMAAMPGSSLALAGGGARLGGNYDQRSHTVTTDVRVGEVNIQTQANDAAGIAKDIKTNLIRQTWVAMSDTGPQ